MLFKHYCDSRRQLNEYLAVPFSCLQESRTAIMKKKIKKSIFWNINEISEDTHKGLAEDLFLNTMEEWYKAKHRKTSNLEIEFLNSLFPDECPHCKSEYYVKNCHRKDGLQTYKCKLCKNRFNILTGTIFDNHKIPISEWIEYLIHLFEFHSIKTSARDNKNVDTTGTYWILKIFEVLKNYQDGVVLSGRIYFDETYFGLMKSKIDKTKGRNQITVGVAYDGKKVIALNEHVVKETFLSTEKYFLDRFEKGSILIHDGNHSHNSIIKKLELHSEVHTNSETKKLEGKKNPLFPINQLHNFMKRFIEDKGGFNRDHLQDWCNLFCFIFNPPKNRYKKIINFIKLAVKHKKIMRFRGTIAKNND